MTKDIYVQAKADHIASLGRATPLGAVEELVWNALDADAREVRVDLLTNALGAVDAVRVSDTGIQKKHVSLFNRRRVTFFDLVGAFLLTQSFIDADA